jgi:tetratricopeptide (TPR) repeat protein
MTHAIDIEWPWVVPPEFLAGGRAAIRLPRPERWCPACEGAGSVAGGAQCRHCEGTGLISEPKELDLVLPGGLAHGSRVPVPGHGIALPAVERVGDLTLTIFADPRGGTRVIGSDLFMECQLTPLEARAGARRVLRTPAGRVSLEIPPHAADGTVFEVRGAGLPDGLGASGSLQVTVRVPPAAPPQRPARQVSSAREALAAGRYREAEMLLRPLADADPQDGEVHYLLGRTLLARGEPREAIGPLRKALSEGRFATPELHVTLGIAYLHLDLPGLAAWQAATALRERALYASATRLLSQALPRFLVEAPAIAGWQEVARQGQEALPEAQRRFFQTAARGFLDKVERSSEPAPLLFTAGLLLAIHGLTTRDYASAAQGIDRLLGLHTAGFAGDVPAIHATALLDGFLTEAPLWARVQLAELAAEDGRFDHAREAVVACIERPPAGQEAQDVSLAGRYLDVADRFRALAAERASADLAVAAGALRLLVDRLYVESVENPDEARMQLLRDAVRDAWIGVHLAPGDEAALTLLADLQDELSAVIARLLARGGAHRNAFFQNSFDALVRGAVPFGALSPEDALKLGSRGLMEHYWWTFDMLFAGQSPLVGEFLADAVPGCYVLTSYRLLLANPELGDYDLLPLTNVQDYNCQRISHGQSRVTIMLRSGGMLDYGRVRTESVPPASLVRRLLHEARWTALGQSDLAELRSGYGGEQYRPPAAERPLPPGPADALLEATPLDDGAYEVQAALAAPMGAEGAAADGAARFCPGCGKRLEDDWVFCAGCGRDLRSLGREGG